MLYRIFKDRNLISIIFLFFCISCAVERPKPGSAVSDFQEEFLSEINRIRKSGCKCGKVSLPPAPPLTWNSQLELAAARHASDMSANNYFAHTGKTGESLRD